MRRSDGSEQPTVWAGEGIVNSAIGSGNVVTGNNAVISRGGPDAIEQAREAVRSFRAAVAQLPTSDRQGQLLVAVDALRPELETERPHQGRVQAILQKMAAAAVPLGMLADVAKIAEVVGAVF